MSSSTAEPPEVTVLVMTYNHVRFIERALDSVLGQRTSFRFEILVSEDCSTDGTRELVVAYRDRYPDKIRLLLSERNLHSNAVVARGIDDARGRYTALLDGDDYWTSDAKLQKQFDFLEQHPECSICFHNARVIAEDGSRPPWNWVPERQQTFSTMDDLWMENFIPTCSAMYRNRLFGKVPDWYSTFFVTESLFITDWPLHLLHAEHGSIGYLDEVMGTYRYHSGGIYSGFPEHEKLEHTYNFLQAMNGFLEQRYDRIIRIAISKYFLDWAEEYTNRADWARARHCFKRCWTAAPFNRRLSLLQLLKVGVRICSQRAPALKVPV